MNIWLISFYILFGILFFLACGGVFWASFHLDTADGAKTIRHFAVLCFIAGLLVAARQIVKLIYHF